jgi:hypothetical protein
MCALAGGLNPSDLVAILRLLATGCSWIRSLGHQNTLPSPYQISQILTPEEAKSIFDCVAALEPPNVHYLPCAGRLLLKAAETKFFC